MRISFHTTRGRSENSISPSDSERMTVTEDCEPELPPVSMSMGMKAVSATCAASALSKCVMIRPVNVAETISSMSQGMRCLKRSNVDERRYVLSDGVMPPMISMSSVASSSMTSMASSKVTMPTMRFSVSTTGRARKLYFENMRATSS